MSSSRAEIPDVVSMEQPQVPKLSHVSQTGAAHMVDISNKAETKRSATAVATLLFSNPGTYEALSSYSVIKGDAIAVARVAAFQAAKKTADLIPLAHPGLHITAMSVDINPFPGSQKTFTYTTVENQDEPTLLRSSRGGVTVRARVECQGKTGVEMEAITAAMVGAVTMFDMLKAIDKGLVIMGARVIEKTGGKSGDWIWDERANKLVRPDQNGSLSKDTPKMHNSSRDLTDIDEWNQGLAAEFSTPQEIPTETVVTTSTKRNSTSNEAAPPSFGSEASGLRSQHRTDHSKMGKRASMQARFSDASLQVNTTPTRGIYSNTISAAKLQQQEMMRNTEGQRDSDIAITNNAPVSILGQDSTNEVGISRREEALQDSLHMTELSVAENMQHERAAQSSRARLRKLITSSKPFIDTVGRSFEAATIEEAQVRQATRDMQQGKIQRRSPEWRVETMTPIDSNIWPGQGNHHTKKVDSKGFQAKRFQREWEQSIYSKGTWIR